MAKFEMDALAWVYTGLAIVWTLFLFAGLIFLHLHRHLPCLQIRRLPLLFTGILCLHAYGFICCMAYVIAPLAPCDAEFWIMSIYLPFGIAMFHAANSQFLHVASRQKQFAHGGTVKSRRSVREDQAEELANSRFKRIVRGLERADRINRTLLFIAIGMALQLLLTLFIFFASKKFHPSYGIFDWEVVGTQMEVRMKCSKGWEWWLSIIWQFFWAWIYAPYMLWKSRGVRDVHGWRVQTICCCIAGLPASPLWLSGLYIPQMAPVNQYVVPPAWFAVSIFMMEVVTIAFPIVQVLRTQSLTKETLDAIASWEKRQQLASDSTVAGSDLHSSKSGAFSGTTYASAPTTPVKSSFESHKSDMLTMAALESALRMNPDPLLQFAALKDFSGENVSFLANVAEWKRGWFYTPLPAEEHRLNQFLAAVQMYASFISLDLSEFPINISSKEMKVLHHIFEPATKMLFRNGSVSSSSATPFDSAFPDSSSTTDLKSGVNLESGGRRNLHSATEMNQLNKDSSMADVTVPEAFTTGVFDSAETEIKYLVLTNTWPKFVRASDANSRLEHADSSERDSNWRKSMCFA